MHTINISETYRFPRLLMLVYATVLNEDVLCDNDVTAPLHHHIDTRNLSRNLKEEKKEENG
jgi:hypothetical protein